MLSAVKAGCTQASGPNNKNVAVTLKTFTLSPRDPVRHVRLTPSFSCEHANTIAAKPHPKSACQLQRSLDGGWRISSGVHPKCPDGKASCEESSYGGCPQRDFYPGDRHAPTENEPKKLDAREQEEEKSRDKDVSIHQSSVLGSATKPVVHLTR